MNVAPVTLRWFTLHPEINNTAWIALSYLNLISGSGPPILCRERHLSLIPPKEQGKPSYNQDSRYIGKDLGFDNIEMTTTLAVLAFCFNGILYSILYVCGCSNKHNPEDLVHEGVD